MNRPYIISISAVAGGGKTSVTKAFSDNLNSATAFYFDNYEYTKQPDNISEWVNNGANPDEWDLSFIENDISMAIQSKKFDYIIIDYPFGKNSGYKLGKLIDKPILIETPLDIALVRRIIHDFSDKSKEEIIKQLSSYTTIRKYFLYNNDIK